MVCRVRPEKSDPNRTRITIGGNRITFPGDVGTPTASLELAKLIFNSVLSRPGAKFTTFDICNFYLKTPLNRPEYVRVKLSDVPDEFAQEYNPLVYARNGWVYFDYSLQSHHTTEKIDPNRTRITIGGNRITFPGDVGTPTASLELAKLVFNSILSRPVAKFITFDICNFYLQTPLDRPEYVRFRLSDIPEKFFQDYNLLAYTRDGWVYFEILRGVYGLPESGMLSNNTLEQCLNKAGY